MRRNVFFFSSRRRHTRSVSAFLLNRSSDLAVSDKLLDLVGLATKSNQSKQLIRNGRSASLQRTFKKSFRSEERRGGKECSSGSTRHHEHNDSEIAALGHTPEATEYRVRRLTV